MFELDWYQPSEDQNERALGSGIALRQTFDHVLGNWLRMCFCRPPGARRIQNRQKNAMYDTLHKPYVWRCNMVCEGIAWQAGTGLPILKSRHFIRGNEGSPIALHPVRQILKPFYHHHEGAQATATVQLSRIPVRIVTNRESGAGYEPCVVGKRYSRRPPH